mgnify:CR=1 FL=1
MKLKTLNHLNHIYNDNYKGEYVFISGGSKTNSGIAYLSEIDLEFKVISSSSSKPSSETTSPSPSSFLIVCRDLRKNFYFIVHGENIPQGMKKLSIEACINSAHCVT